MVTGLIGAHLICVMAAKTIEDYLALLSEYNTLQQRLQSKDEALKILKVEMHTLQECNDSMKTEVAQLKSQLCQRLLTPVSDVVVHERELFISQLEECQEKMSSMERLVQSLEDEKADLLTEKTFFSEKCATLEKCMEEREKATPPSRSSSVEATPPSGSLMEAVLEENRLLKLKILGVQAEKEQALNRIERYKRAQERQKDAGQLQVVRISKHHSNHESQKTLQRIGELETLANSLSESVKEKSIALTHQKKANKMLAGRIAELEHRLKVLEISGLLPQRVTTEGGVEQLQVWKADQEEEDGGRHEHCEQDNLSLSGATGTKLATESASHVEVA